MEEEADPSVKVPCLGLLWIPAPPAPPPVGLRKWLRSWRNCLVLNSVVMAYLTVAVFCFLNSLGFSVSKSTKNRI